MASRFGRFTRCEYKRKDWAPRPQVRAKTVRHAGDLRDLPGSGDARGGTVLTTLDRDLPHQLFLLKAKLFQPD